MTGLEAPPQVTQPRAREAAAGLTSEQARLELERVGPNVLAETERPRWLLRFGRNFTHLFALLLWVGSVLAVLGGQPPLAIAIVAVIVVNAVFSFAQEYRAERAVEALRRILPQRVRVRRDGRPREIAAEEIVPGDVVLLAAGDRVCADGDLLEEVELKVDLSTLTGESRPARRHVAGVSHGRTGIEAPDRVFAGTHVVVGSGEALITATGMDTELGRIAQLTQRTGRRPSPLELEMGRMTRLVAIMSVSIGAAFFLLAGSLGMSVTDRFVFAIGVIVANVPEGLLPTVTLSLALATERMARRNALVRRLSSVETLGATTVICTDKTGTLTANEMTVRRIWMGGSELEVSGAGYAPEGTVEALSEPPDPAALAELARAGALCNDATLEARDGRWMIVGDPTEAALLTLAHKIGLDPAIEAHRYPRRRELPFDSARRRMTTVHAGPNRLTAYIKGAPSAVIPRTTLDDAGRRAALAAADAMARDSLRVLAVARRTGSLGSFDGDQLERELELLGLVGMHDPPRPEVAEAIQRCRAAGIRVIMVTGDHGLTAEAIAQRIGLIDGRAAIVDGAGLDRLDDRELVAALAQSNALVSRVAPEQKLRIATVLRDAREVVAMTGDGVNDAPALRAADIGVAMGRTGTDVAREAADIILLDDNFASIAAAVEEGRAVYDNIRRFAQYHFSSNVAELLAFLAWGLSGGAIPLPLVVMQVLAVDLGTDLLPAIALGTERAEPGVMKRPPRPRSERLLNARVLGRVYGYVGLIVGVAGLASFFAGYWLAGWRPGEPLADEGALYIQATAMTYAGIVMGQVGAGLAFRTSRRSVFAVGLLSNRFLLMGIAFEIALLLALVYVPALQNAFHMRPLDPLAWPLLAVWPIAVLGAEEARKAVFRRRVWKEVAV
ncbi:MAG TPA: cation-transporting P-type ATPase [Solirubrobacteraceae bacterium]|nr:cation-transporting P-type ATPase [Solirubrobacteraceae bacterium]